MYCRIDYLSISAFVGATGEGIIIFFVIISSGLPLLMFVTITLMALCGEKYNEDKNIYNITHNHNIA